MTTNAKCHDRSPTLNRCERTADQARSTESPLTATGRILIVHSADAAPALADELRGVGHDARTVRADSDVINSALTDEPDLVVVALTAECADAINTCRRLREVIACRIVVVGGPDEVVAESFVVDLLDAGADDYIAASASTRVLHARIRLALRDRGVSRRTPTIELGDVVIDVDARTLMIGGDPVQCSRRLFDVLVALASQPGQLVLCDTLLSTVWGVPPKSVHPRRIRTAISLLRGTIGRGPHRPSIESQSGIGYRLIVPKSS